VGLKEFVTLSASSGVMVWYVPAHCVSQFSIYDNIISYLFILLTSLVQLGELVLPDIGFPHGFHEERRAICGCTVYLVD
jgi:hypothetical protein